MSESEQNDDLVEDAIPETIVTKVNEGKCATCAEPASRICTHCGQYFCTKHYCVSHEVSTASDPLIDDEGVEHKGRRIRLIGEGWPNALLLIKDLSDAELDIRIKQLQDLLQQAVRTADYAQICIAHLEFQRDYKAHSRYVAAMKRREKLEQGSIRLNNKKHRIDASGAKVAIPSDIAALMKLGNLTFDQAVAMKALLGGKVKT